MGSLAGGGRSFGCLLMIFVRHSDVIFTPGATIFSLSFVVVLVVANRRLGFERSLEHRVL